MTFEEAMNKGLPKWPMCIIKGERITEEQALEIIRRTDTFFEGYDGNNKTFNKEAYNICRRPSVASYDNYTEFAKAQDEIHNWESKWGLIPTEYIHNDWISSSYIYGPHGWCHPDGTIEYHDTIGKWPEVKNVYDDLKKIIEIFPFINMKCTLMSGESQTDMGEPIVSMHAHDGIVEVIDTLNMNELTFEPDIIDFAALVNNVQRENYFSLDVIQRWSDEVFKDK